VKPFDPRLLRYAGHTRRYLAGTVGLSLTSVGLVLAQATLIATAVSAAFASGAGLAELTVPLGWLAATVAGRALVTWAQEVTSARAAAGVKSQLRRRVLAHVVELGPAWLHTQRAAQVTTLATRGLDALDAYFAKYLPQLVLAALVPAIVVAFVLPADLIAAATIIVTLPLIPIFMALVGLATEQRNRAQFAALNRLSRHLLEVVSGLPTLKALARARAHAAAIGELSTQQRRVTMGTLRLAFLSSLVLELLATLSVALVAVGIGLRVVGGGLDLRTALLVLILAPEAYLPLRALGTHYHASAEGLAAASDVFAILETPLPERPAAVRPVPGPAPLIIDRVSVSYDSVLALPSVSLRVEPGETVALTGPSGCGKSTLLNVVMGFLPPTTGTVSMAGVELGQADLADWRSHIAYVPQRPYLFAGTVCANIALGVVEVDADAVRRAADDAGLGGLDMSTVVGEGGVGLSAGQRQRVALARALLRSSLGRGPVRSSLAGARFDAPLTPRSSLGRGPVRSSLAGARFDAPLTPRFTGLFVLDEPTASLDEDTEADILVSLRKAAPDATVLLVTHRPAVLAAADRVVHLPADEGEPMGVAV
jgi:ATP-binding cassette subfamily C protein CydD/ATP-binding cassette subfamily C protein CydCD